VTRPRVLLVTGAYYPEISAAGGQAREAARVLADRAEFSVITTAVDRRLPPREVVDGVAVHRLPIDVNRGASRARAAAQLTATFIGLQRSIDIVHVHGFSSKNVPLTVLARTFRKPIVLTLHTVDQDDPPAVLSRGRLAAWAYRSADVFLPVSPFLSDRYRASGLPIEKLEEVPNGIDIDRFRPASDQERVGLRRDLGLPLDGAIVLFVGFFSRDKRPDLLFDAWLRLTASLDRAVHLVCVGATASPYFEIDPALAAAMRARAARAGVGECLAFVEPTLAIERYFRAADVFALPSAREAMPLALLEAMACGLPAIATRLPRATDVIIDHGRDGLLFDTVDELATGLGALLTDRARAAEIGRRARQRIVEHFTVDRMASRWLSVYARLMPRRGSAG